MSSQLRQMEEMMRSWLSRVQFPAGESRPRGWNVALSCVTSSLSFWHFRPDQAWAM